MREIKALREARGISQQQLAQSLEIDRSTVAKWETSDICPRGERLVALADTLNCSIDALFGRSPPDGEGGEQHGR